MDVYVLNADFETVDIIDDYFSLIWTIRYNECGDFELQLPLTPEYLTYAQNGWYLSIRESKRYMIMEEYDVSSDAEKGMTLTINGRSLESILDRRIVWSQTKINGKFQNGVKKLIDDAFINPKLSERKISNFKFAESNSSAIKNSRLKKQFTGDNIYDVIVLLCQTYGFGFKLVPNSKNELVFSIYNGTNRKDEVIFSPEYDNLLSSEFYFSDRNRKTVALVAGEDEGTKRTTLVVKASKEKGIDRREIYVDARDIQSEEDDRTKMSDADYKKLLQLRGFEKLAEYKTEAVLEGEANLDRSFHLGEDYDLGDIVSLRNEMGLELDVRIVEIIRSYSAQNGYTAVPSFEVYYEPSTIIEDDEASAETSETKAEAAASSGYSEKVTATADPSNKDTQISGSYILSKDSEIRNSPRTKGKVLATVKKGSSVKTDGRYTSYSGIVWYYVEYESNAGNDGTVLYTGFINSNSLTGAAAKNKQYLID